MLSKNEVQFMIQSLQHTALNGSPPMPIPFEMAMELYQTERYRLARAVDALDGETRWHIIHRDSERKIPLLLNATTSTDAEDPWEDEQFDEIIERLEIMFHNLSDEVRWQIAIDFYEADEVSSGRAAEIAGMDCFSFRDKMKMKGIEFKRAYIDDPVERAKIEELIYATTNIPRP